MLYADPRKEDTPEQQISNTYMYVLIKISRLSHKIIHILKRLILCTYRSSEYVCKKTSKYYRISTVHIGVFPGSPTCVKCITACALYL